MKGHDYPQCNGQLTAFTDSPKRSPAINRKPGHAPPLVHSQTALVLLWWQEWVFYSWELRPRRCEARLSRQRRSPPFPKPNLSWFKETSAAQSSSLCRGLIPRIWSVNGGRSSPLFCHVCPSPPSQIALRDPTWKPSIHQQIWKM